MKDYGNDSETCMAEDLRSERPDPMWQEQFISRYRPFFLTATVSGHEVQAGRTLTISTWTSCISTANVKFQTVDVYYFRSPRFGGWGGGV